MKPEGRSQLLLSPADESPDSPGDARPRELDIARCIDQVNAVTTLSIRRVRSSWAGHRTFAADRIPVVGFDANAKGFFWCAALGGSGIQNTPAIAELAGALLCHEQRGRRFGVLAQSDALLPRSVVQVAPTSTSARPATFRPVSRWTA